MDFEKIYVLGVGLTNLSEKKILEYIIKNLQRDGKKYYIVTPNPELLVIATKQERYKNVLNGAKIALPDGIGIVLASKLLGKPISARITGVGFMENLCKEVSKWPITVGFLGGGSNVAGATAECLRKKYPGLNVGLVLQEWSEDLIFKKIDILFIAFGSPKQELWIAQNLKKLPATVSIGVGGAFDFISGKVPRSPKILRDLGLEWLFRLIVQPWRIKRQLSIITFVLLVLKEKMSKNKI
jgi:N-acetylglucosaminyldiphosphoundecaprenol N-acetyl-beta-D-mannosaminyltransferase